MFRVIPFKRHVQTDLLTGLFSLGAPWLFGFAHNAKARKTFLSTGMVALAAGVLTRPEEMPGRPWQITGVN